MFFRNQQALLENATSTQFHMLRRDALDILETAVRAVDPSEAIRRNLALEGSLLKTKGLEWDLNKFKEVYVVGGGKASGAMAKALEYLLGDRISTGIINVLRGTEEAHKTSRIELNGASHPVPDESGVIGVERMIELLDGAGASDLVIVLISGGGSSLLSYPAKEVSLNDMRDITSKLLISGATIGELNTVRKHLSSIKGGLMAKSAYPSTVVSLILSDVVGDPLDTIASGPTAPDETTFADAIEILKRRNIWEQAPKTVKERLESGCKGEIPETPKKGDQSFDKVSNIIIGNNLEASRAATEKATDLGYNAMLLSTQIEGEAREVGRNFGSIVLEITEAARPIKPPAALVAGGETTVTVEGNGIGGRNQEVALAASLKIAGIEAVLAAFATDGIDGPTEAAGALVDGSTLERAECIGLEPIKFLKENDSYTFFKRLGDALITGPTGTNVNDLTLILVGPKD
ncbi:MAG: glycerate kinase, partial [Candidatus Bathyarchaeota archaeon]